MPQFCGLRIWEITLPLVMITGNHDCLAEYSIYKQYNPAAASKNVFFLRGDGGSTCFLKT